MEITVDTIFGNYKCRTFTDVDPDVSGIEVSLDGNRIGSIIDESLPEDDDVEAFVNMLEVWLIDNE